MPKRSLRFAGLLLLPLVYILCHFVYAAVGRTDMNDHRGFLFVWTLIAVLASGPACGGLSRGWRIAGGGLIGLAATLFIPTWSGHGCWAPDLNAAILTGVLFVVLGALAANHGPSFFDRLMAHGTHWAGITVVALVITLSGSALATLSPIPRSALTPTNGAGPRTAFRWTDRASLLDELRPKLLGRDGIYGGEVAMTGHGVIQAVSNGTLRWIGPDGRRLSIPSVPPARYADNTWRELQTKGDLLLLARCDQLWPALVCLPSFDDITPDISRDTRADSAYLTEEGAWLYDGGSLHFWDARGHERWIYEPQSRPIIYPELTFRSQRTLGYLPGQRGDGRNGGYLTRTPAGPVATFAREVTALTADGQIRWQRETEGRFMAIDASSDGGLVTALEQRPLPGRSGESVGVVVAYAGTNGAVLWEWTVPDEVFALSWCLANDSVLLSLDKFDGDARSGELQALARDGSLLWRQPNDSDEMGPIITRIIPVERGFIMAGDSQVRCLARDTGAVRYALRPDDRPGETTRFRTDLGPLLWGDTLVLTTGRRLHAFAVSTGESLWTFDEPYGITGLSAYGDRLAIGNARGITVLAAPLTSPQS